MTKVTTSFGEEFFTVKYADPTTCSYVYYPCCYCQELFQLIDPENGFRAGGAVRKKLYRNPNTGEIAAVENRSEGVCLQCAKEIMRR
jgi:hypothetical protein